MLTGAASSATQADSTMSPPTVPFQVGRSFTTSNSTVSSSFSQLSSTLLASHDLGPDNSLAGHSVYLAQLMSTSSPNPNGLLTAYEKPSVGTGDPVTTTTGASLLLPDFASPRQLGQQPDGLGNETNEPRGGCDGIGESGTGKMDTGVTSESAVRLRLPTPAFSGLGNTAANATFSSLLMSSSPTAPAQLTDQTHELHSQSFLQTLTLGSDVEEPVGESINQLLAPTRQPAYPAPDGLTPGPRGRHSAVQQGVYRVQSSHMTGAEMLVTSVASAASTTSTTSATSAASVYTGLSEEAQLTAYLGGRIETSPSAGQAGQHQPNDASTLNSLPTHAHQVELDHPHPPGLQHQHQHPLPHPLSHPLTHQHQHPHQHQHQHQHHHQQQLHHQQQQQQQQQQRHQQQQQHQHQQHQHLQQQQQQHQRQEPYHLPLHTFNGQTRLNEHLLHLPLPHSHQHQHQHQHHQHQHQQQQQHQHHQLHHDLHHHHAQSQPPTSHSHPLMTTYSDPHHTHPLTSHVGPGAQVTGYADQPQSSSNLSELHLQPQSEELTSGLLEEEKASRAGGIVVSSFREQNRIVEQPSSTTYIPVSRYNVTKRKERLFKRCIQPISFKLMKDW
ncbi:unnamed protein product [Protopolystoma xenopodis]|uniref:Uncharacterized protein n=1 Tax=Protopolystoma xenopodis TaxID=117903 RepID=A0A3S5FGW2_9PLAT|nr:unnamed protein product [Protopolystoma xenopodis]